MKKIIAIGASILLIMQSSSSAYIQRNADITYEKTIPFSFNSNTHELEETIDIEDMDNVKIKKIYVDNGEVEASVEGDYIYMNFFDGNKSSSSQKVLKTGVLEVEESLTDEKTGVIEYSSKEEVKDILEVSGDFLSATVNTDGSLKIQVDKNAVGNVEYDEREIVTSKVNVQIEKENRLRKVTSKEINLEHKPVGEVKAVSGDTSKVENIHINEKSIEVEFNNGDPKLNETVVNDGYTYSWIDRDSNGKFSPHIPNSIYTTDKNVITGKGEYLSDEEKDEIGMKISNKNWTDYCGAEIDGNRYIYPFDLSKGKPEGKIVDEDGIMIKGQAFNTEKYKVKFSGDGVEYIPEGKLYSMGELISGTSGWGESYSNHDWESKDSFYNKITGKSETYVKHYKFFYGPKVKKAFGGFYTYPYNCVVEYEHYKPVNVYSGDIIYTYEKTENIKGYLYNGWVKVTYTENKVVNDYPPTAPYNIKNSGEEGIISWEEGTDDYTPNDKLYYEMQMYSDLWGNIKKSALGQNYINIDEIANISDIRIRTVDEVGQTSEWAYLSDNVIELEGKISPYIVSSGENINIYAKTKSLSKIEKVEAKCKELEIDSKLEMISERKPNYFEMSYDLMADFLEEDEYIYVANGRYAKSYNGKYRNYGFKSNAKTNKDVLEIEIPETIPFYENGTLIFPNGNYLNSELDIFKYNGKNLHLYLYNSVETINKVNGNKETFVAFVNYPNKNYVKSTAVFTFIPRIIINTFEYDSNGYPKYAYIDVPSDIADKPLIVRWKTDAQRITTIDVCAEDTLIYSYKASRDEIEKFVSSIASMQNQKKLKKYVLSSSGYTLPNKRFEIKWAKIVLSVANRYNLQDFPWLGYKVANNEYVREVYIQNYNNNPEVRNTYRTLILDEYASNTSVKKYLNLIKTTNLPITREREKSVFGDKVLDYNCEFEMKNVNINKLTKPGKYEVELIATDTGGKSNKIKLNVIIKDNQNEMYPEFEENKTVEIKNIKVGRFFYKDGDGYLEELKKDSKNINTEGFISAGETLCIVAQINNSDYIKLDFSGDKSIKELDTLTKKFLIDKPRENGKNVDKIAENYDKFPKIIYPIEGKYTFFYTIPYKTKQNLESWSTLKTGTLENIDTQKLFDRKFSPYKLKIYISGSEPLNYEIPFDVFERWDTILNRNVRSFISNSNSKWEMKVDK